MDHPGTGRGLINFAIVGGILLVTGILASVDASAATQLARTATQRRWTWPWLATAAWLLVSPWIVGYSSVTQLTANAVVCAVAVGALAVANWMLTNRMGPDDHRGIVPPSGRLDVKP